MSKTIKINKKVNNSEYSAMHEVEDVILDVIEQLFDAGFEPEDIIGGIEVAFAEMLREN